MWLNVEADWLAKAKVAILHMGPTYYKISGNPWGCYINTQCIVKQFKMSIRNFINGRETMDYWVNHKNLHPEQLQETGLPWGGQCAAFH